METVFGQIRLRRGASTAIPTLGIGEPFFAEDTKQLWVGTADGNVPIVAESGALEGLAAHIEDTEAAHAASAISFVGSVTFSATNVQSALAEVDANKASHAEAQALTFLEL